MLLLSKPLHQITLDGFPQMLVKSVGEGVGQSYELGRALKDGQDMAFVSWSFYQAIDHARRPEYDVQNWIGVQE